MPDDLVILRRVVANAARRQREATQARDLAVAAIRARGGSLREIGQLTGLSHTAIHKIASRTDICMECLSPGSGPGASHLETCSLYVETP